MRDILRLRQRFCKLQNGKIGGWAVGIGELTMKMQTLSPEEYHMVAMLVDRLSDKPSNVLKAARNKYMGKNPMSMEEIDEEIEAYRREKRG